MICLLVMTDGRDDLLARTLASAEENLVGPITERVIYDDTGDFDHKRRLLRAYPGYAVVGQQRRAGFGGAIRAAWAMLRAASKADYVFHLEDDFTFNRPVDLAAMAALLSTHTYLAQLALRRQPWNDEERAAGGIVEQHPDDFLEVSDLVRGERVQWLEHRRFFTTNPSLYRRSLIDLHDWPAGDHSEGVFTHELLAHAETRFAYWGSRASGEWVHHIGDVRAGVGY